MIKRVFKKELKGETDRYKYFSIPYIEIYYPREKTLIKNYIIEPHAKIVK